MKYLYINKIGGFYAKVYDGELPLPENVIQVDDALYQDLLDHKVYWKGGELVVNKNYDKYLKKKEKKDIKKIKATYKHELEEIHDWFVKNDWKPNKIITDEWSEDDPRWLEYKQERAVKRARQDELNELLKKIQ